MKKNIIQSNFPFVKQTNGRDVFQRFRTVYDVHFVLFRHFKMETDNGDDCFDSDWPQKLKLNALFFSSL